MELGMVYTIITAENKLLLEEGKKQGVEFARYNDSELLMPVTDVSVAKNKSALPEMVLQRSSSFTRTLYTTLFFEAAGSRVVNSLRTQQICGDKAYSSALLAKAGVATPRTFVSCSKESAMQAIDSLGYPCVIKPTIGSWARMVNRINDRDAAEAILESREVLGGPWQQIYYLQEHIDKPGRDIRAFVVGDEVIAAIYRISTEKSGWLTNTGRGGRAENCPVTGQMREIILRAVSIVDKGIYGVDLMESKEGGFVVHEINHTTEFRNSITPTGVNIPGKMIEWLKKEAKS
ncbi:lysine biosynthesis protein LysX [Candidatus Parvarchaeota archaeon]|nr:lysine biosynthesis protein LysX [Candidatus Parvarchaeota archaeon]